MNHSVTPWHNVCNYFRGCYVIPPGIVHHIQVGRRPAVDRERHVATRPL